MLEKFGVITAVMPSVEWSYQQPLTQGGFQRIPPKGCAGDDTSLVKQVRQFRVNVGLSIDNVELDVANYIRTNSPINDKYPGRTQPVNPPHRILRAIRPLIERIRDWLMVVGAKQPRLLIEDEAKQRGAVCAKCPQNIEWRTGCLPCCDEVIQRGRHVRQRIDYPYADALRGCRAHGFYLPTAVFLDRDALGEVKPDAPENCWMRTEAQST